MRVVILLATLVLVLLLPASLRTPAPNLSELDPPAPPGDSASTAKESAADERSIVDTVLAGICEDDAAASEIGSEADLIGTMEELREKIQRAKERLSLSNAAEHLHLAAILAADPVERLALIARTAPENSGDAHLLRDAVVFCAAAREQAPCPLTIWEERLLAVDRHNSESWALVATNRYEAGDVDGALQAMYRAASAAESRSYWPESIELIERTFAAAGDFSFQERAAHAISIAPTTFRDYGANVRMCSEASSDNAEWAQVCLAYGELIEKQARTDLLRILGLGLQQQMLESLGSAEQAAAVRQRQEIERQRRVEPQRNAELILRLIVNDPVVFATYVAAIRVRGEAGARATLRKEAELWLARNAEHCAQ